MLALSPNPHSMPCRSPCEVSNLSSAHPSHPISGAQLIVETLYAVLALGSVALLGLREISGMGSEFRNLALMVD